MLVQSVPLAVVRRTQASRSRLPSLAQAHHYHVDNRVNQNFPFRYEGASKTRFTVGFVAFVAAGFSVPFLACAFQLKKAAA